jgi:AmmeMemoRadiSam system protein A
VNEAAEDSHNESFLNRDEQRIALDIARRAICEWARERRRIEWSTFDLTEMLRRNCGCFVTVRTDQHLRGCIGSIAHNDPLAKAVRDNAISAVSRDPRFDPIEPHELDSLTIEISALTQGDEPGTPFRRVQNIEEIQIGRDGICIQVGEKRGLLLPQVATERHWGREQFLAATCLKAGVADTAWREPHAVLYRFSAQVFGDG